MLNIELYKKLCKNCLLGGKMNLSENYYSDEMATCCIHKSKISCPCEICGDEAEYGYMGHSACRCREHSSIGMENVKFPFKKEEDITLFMEVHG